MRPKRTITKPFDNTRREQGVSGVQLDIHAFPFTTRKKCLISFSLQGDYSVSAFFFLTLQTFLVGASFYLLSCIFPIRLASVQPLISVFAWVSFAFGLKFQLMDCICGLTGNLVTHRAAAQLCTHSVRAASRSKHSMMHDIYNTWPAS